MAFFDKITGKKEDGAQAETRSPGKYDKPCSLCSKTVTDKKWMGQYWHKKCLRQMRKGAGKMI